MPVVTGSFHTDIPQRMAIQCMFRNLSAKKVAIFRLFPISVHDMLRIPSPVNFWETFLIAERKVRGFDNLMTIVRDPGWRSWLAHGEERAAFRASVEATLDREGVAPPSTDPIYRLAISCKRCVDRVIVWRRTTTRGPKLFSVSEYDAFLECLRLTMGFW